MDAEFSAIGTRQAPLIPTSLEHAPSPKGGEADRLGMVTKEFEAVFLSILLKQLRSSQEEGLFPGDRSDALGSLFDLHLGRALAEAGMLPLGPQLRSQVSPHRLSR